MLYPKIGIRPVIDGRWGGVRESLEVQTMNMANGAARLISENLKYPDGTPVQCVVGCTTIGGGAEAAKVAEQFSTENVVATLSVTPCWCYGTETFDMDPNTIKAVWGFNGTERPGAVYLAAVLAAHAQRGLPAFSIYGHDVQDAADTAIPEDVSEKILRFARAAVAVGWMRNKAYVNVGAVAMGIAGSYCDADVMQKYLGIRAEWGDEVDILRRMALPIFDEEEYQKALAWIRENCPEGLDKNLGKNLPEIITRSKVIAPDKDWEFIAKMSIIIRDILFGNPKLAELGWHEEALKKVLWRIRTDCDKQLSLNDLAQEAGLAPRYFCRIFRELTGRTPMDYLNYYRIERASELLCSTDDTIINIAFSCGFHDAAYFSRIFRRYKQMSPREYRQTHQEDTVSPA